MSDGELIEVNLNQSNNVMLTRPPEAVLEEAKKAATALMNVVSQKKNPVRLNGEIYLEYEDWQTVARFYGLTAKVVKTDLIKIDNVVGYEAYAEVIRNTDGQVISAASSMCLNDEEKWTSRAKYEYVSGKRVKVGEVPVPLFQLRSMAQTRACAKALRNVLAWVVVLAGFKPNVAEEMTGLETPPPAVQPTQDPPKAEIVAPTPHQAPARPSPATPGNVISEPQRKRLFAIAMGAGMRKDYFKDWLSKEFGYGSSADISRDDYDMICERAEEYNPVEEA